MIKIATLNVKGLNDRIKAQKTLTLLKSYKLDIIFIQETNLNNAATRKFLAQQWSYDSLWTSKMAILVEKPNIKLKNTKISHNNRVISAKITFKNRLYLFTNVYAPSS